MSSIRHITPSRPSKIAHMVRWKISGAELMLKGNLLKQKTRLSPSVARLSSTEPMGWISRLTALFSSVKSTQICICPLALGTGTKAPKHQSVTSMTGEMTPYFNIESISFFTLGSNGCGIFLGVWTDTSSTSGLSLIWYSVFNFPRPVKSWGNSSLRLIAWVTTSPIRQSNPGQQSFLIEEGVQLILENIDLFGYLATLILQHGVKSTNDWENGAFWTS